MKKILIPIIIIFTVLAVLFVPIPKAAFDDGGTREYVALTYKIVDWNKVSADGVYEKTCIYFGADRNKTIDELWELEKSGIEGNNTNKLYDIQHQIPNYTDIKCVTEKETYSKDVTVIRYTLTNVTEGEAWINPDKACFDLQKQVDGVWKSVGTKVDHYWTEMAMLLPPGESETREINLEDYFYLPLEEGTYRIEIEGILSNNFEISY